MQHVIHITSDDVNDPDSIFTFTNSGVLQEYAEIVAEINRRKGWFDKDRTFGDECSLLHSEVSEALEEFRERRLVTTFRENDGKPEGLPSELADVLVRLLDTAYRYNVDLEHEFLIKLEYNATRPVRHGNKAL